MIAWQEGIKTVPYQGKKGTDGSKLISDRKLLKFKKDQWPGES